jgi:hypothetical protein
MKILFKAIFLYFFGLYFEFYRKLFDKRIEFLLRRNMSLSDKLTVKMANSCCFMQTKFRVIEHELLLCIR